MSVYIVIVKSSGNEGYSAQQGAKNGKCQNVIFSTHIIDMEGKVSRLAEAGG